jgi:hypothetical protein
MYNTDQLLATVGHFWRRIARKSRAAEVGNDTTSENMDLGKRIRGVIENRNGF